MFWPLAAVSVKVRPGRAERVEYSQIWRVVQVIYFHKSIICTEYMVCFFQASHTRFCYEVPSRIQNPEPGKTAKVVHSHARCWVLYKITARLPMSFMTY